eukprot:TRINITY_DN7385_c0_g1_i1.p1 TRINITY_DN7385_c0_g1~~TRINITY_DN7385_c0_g1_i1.p1  ORF type:complete len:243 (+),score=62.71 TRINITY_DN7385_c0_g1_i1:25-729(+)
MSASASVSASTPSTTTATASTATTTISSATTTVTTSTSSSSSLSPSFSSLVATFSKDENSRGIPSVIFIENVDGYCEKFGSADVAFKELQNLYGKYKFMESQLIQQKKGLLSKIPDIKNALNTLQVLIDRQDSDESVKTTFQVSETVYAKAEIQNKAKTIFLWLGANVMLEYGYKEAEELLTKNLKNARTTVDSLDKDLDFLKDQITTCEVNVARVHNHRVKLRQETTPKKKSS